MAPIFSNGIQQVVWDSHVFNQKVEQVGMMLMLSQHVLMEVGELYSTSTDWWRWLTLEGKMPFLFIGGIQHLGWF